MTPESLASVALLGTVACFSSPSARPPSQEVQRHLGPTASGRVLLDGRPVTYFAIGLARDQQHAAYDEAPKVFDHRDGRFSIEIPIEGTWDIVIAGPSFGRTVLPGVHIGPGANVLPDVNVEHGYAIEGTVTDEGGAPIANATVTITSDRIERSELAWNAMRGNFVTETDVDGYFKLRGVRILAPTAVISVESPTDRSRSLDEPILDRDQTLKLVVRPLGRIEGAVRGRVEQPMAVMLTTPLSRVMKWTVGVNSNGGFVIEDVPAATYQITWISAKGEPGMPRSVHVEGGKTTDVFLMRL